MIKIYFFRVQIFVDIFFFIFFQKDEIKLLKNSKEISQQKYKISIYLSSDFLFLFNAHQFQSAKIICFYIENRFSVNLIE